MAIGTSPRALGGSGIEVSRLALGSWRTFERMSQREGLSVMLAARDAGITFLDDARYDDETGTAPIPTGYSEVLFGELFRQAGWRRDETVVANKLWWEFWPRQSVRGRSSTGRPSCCTKPRRSRHASDCRNRAPRSFRTASYTASGSSARR